jgi:hypothetical protein
MPVWHAFATYIVILCKKESNDFLSVVYWLSKLSEIAMFGGFSLYMHCKKRLPVFPSPAGMSLTIRSLAGNNLIFPGQGQFGK